MGQTEATRQSDWISPPYTDSTGKFQGAAIAVTSTAAFIDLTTVPAIPANWPNVPGTTFQPPGATFQVNILAGYFRLLATGGDVYVNFGQASAHVSGANAPLATATTTVTAGVLATAIQVAWRIVADHEIDYKIHPGNNEGVGGGDVTAAGVLGGRSPGRFMGYVTATGVTATLRIAASSTR